MTKLVSYSSGWRGRRGVSEQLTLLVRSCQIEAYLIFNSLCSVYHEFDICLEQKFCIQVEKDKRVDLIPSESQTMHQLVLGNS